MYWYGSVCLGCLSDLSTPHPVARGLFRPHLCFITEACANSYMLYLREILSISGYSGSPKPQEVKKKKKRSELLYRASLSL